MYKVINTRTQAVATFSNYHSAVEYKKLLFDVFTIESKLYYLDNEIKIIL